jgi:hypothetical protein
MTPHPRGVRWLQEATLEARSARRLVVRVVIEDEAGNVEERRLFTAVDSSGELLVNRGELSEDAGVRRLVAAADQRARADRPRRVAGT